MSRPPTESIDSDTSSASFWDRYFAVGSSDTSASRRQSLKLPYIPALDGIRALAVAAVLVYHASVGWLPGGFLGVEVFFVLSGYLITSILLAEYRRDGRVDLKSFWLRRARRLLPALFFLLAATLTYAVIVMPQQVAQLRSDAAAAAFYVMNWWLIFDHKSYFEAMGRPSLLKHLWSLAVEEQFYVIWPLLFLLAISRLRERRMLLAVVVGAIASTALVFGLYQPGVDPSRIYYGTDTRAAELLVGAALAIVWRPGVSVNWAAPLATRLGRWLAPGNRAKLVLESLGLAALAGIGAAFWQFGEYNPALYHGGFLLVAVATATLIAVVVHPRTTFMSRVFGCAPLRWIGLRSYGIYLWHWPVYMVTRPGLDVPLSGLPLMALRVVVTLALVELSYRFVEMPFRSGRVGQAWRALRHEREQQPRSMQVGWLGVSGAVAMSAIVLVAVVARAQPATPPPYLAVQEVHIVASSTATVRSEPTTPPVMPTPTSETPATQSPASTHVPISNFADVLGSDLPAATASIETPIETPANSATVAVPTVIATVPPPPTPTPTPTSTAVAAYASAPTVTAVGDSVMLGASTDLAKTIPNLDLDAKVGLQVSAAIQILQARLDAGRLQQVVVLDIGNNGPMTSAEFDQIMQVIGSERRVIFLNLRVPRSWEGPNNDVLASGVARYPNASLLDWHAATVDHPELFWDDGIHLRPVGARYYAMLVAHQVESSK